MLRNNFLHYFRSHYPQLLQLVTKLLITKKIKYENKALNVLSYIKFFLNYFIKQQKVGKNKNA